MRSAIVLWLLAASAFAQGPQQPPLDLSQFEPAQKKIGMFQGSYAKCLLDELPGVASDAAAWQIASACQKRYPEGLNTIESRGLFGFDSPGECIAKKARDTASRAAASLISGACYHLYRPSK